MTAVRRLSLAEIRALLTEPLPEAIPAAQQDEMAIPSYLHPNPLIRWLMWRRYEVVAELCRLSPAKTALEFGCGIGLFLPTLAGTCRKVYAVDLFPAYARRLCARYAPGVVFADRLEDIPAGSLDIIVAADVLEHIDELDAYLDRFCELLAPGGRLVVSGPTENIIYKLGRVAAGFAGKGDYHVSNINLLVPAIQASGFRLLDERRLPFFFPPHLFRIAAFLRP